MNYSTNADYSVIKYKGKPVIKAADQLGSYVIKNIMKYLNKATKVETSNPTSNIELDNNHYVIIPLTYASMSQAWLSAKNSYVLFNTATDSASKLVAENLIKEYLQGRDNPLEITVANVDGALTTVGNLPIATTDGKVIDIEVAAKRSAKKLERDPLPKE